MEPRRIPGGGWLTLLGGGEFSFGETLDADRAWLSKAPPGLIGFLPAASGSVDYGRHFSEYLKQHFDREVALIPIYRARDARRQKNLERIDRCVAVYLGGGVVDHLLEAVTDTPVVEALGRKLAAGGVVVAIAAAAQAMGEAARSLSGAASLSGMGWLPQGVVEPNFDPAHDRRFRWLMGQPGVRWGVGLSAGSALLLGPAAEIQSVGTWFALQEADGDFEVHR